MRKLWAVSITVLILFSILSLIGHIGSNAYMFRGNLNRTGIYNSTVPESNSLLWSFETGSAMESSPGVVGNRVYFGSENGKVYSLNASSGIEIWNFATDNAVKSTPAVVDGVVYLGSTDGNLYVLDGETGDKFWNYSLPFAQIKSSPAVTNDRIFFGASDGYIYALNASSHELEWTFPTGGEIWSSPAVDWPCVYVGSLDGSIYCIWANNGTKRWNYTIGQQVYSSPAVHNDKVFVGSSGYPFTKDGAMLSLDKNTGKLIWLFNTNGYVYSSPAVHDGKVFFGTAPESDESFIYALPEDDPNGDGIIEQTEILWRTYSDEYEEGGSSPSVADGKVLVGSRGGRRLLCLNESTGEELWNLTIGHGIVASPAIADGVVYISSYGGTVYAVGGNGPASLEIQILPEFPSIKSGRVMGISFLVTYRDAPVEGAFIKVDISEGNLSQYGASTFPDGSQRIKYTAWKVEENTTITIHATVTKFGYPEGESWAQFTVESPSSYGKVSSGSTFSLSRYWVYITLIGIFIVVNVIIFVVNIRKRGYEENKTDINKEVSD